MKRIAVMCFLTALAVSGAFISSYVYENELPKASVTAMADIKFTEQVSASGNIVEYKDELCVSAAISQNDITKIRTGQRVSITGRGIKECYGTVENISDTARTRMNGMTEETVVDVRIGFDENSDLTDIKNGYTVRIRIDVSDEKDIGVVPYKAVHSDDDGREFVYVFSNGMSVRKYIETGLETSEGIEILSGISHYDTVLISEGDGLSDGEYVKIGE